LTGCKSSDYKEALKLEEAGEYDSALEIFESLEDYKDSSSHVALCKDMSTAIKEFDSAKSELEEKNEKLD
jgi:hypothetical protein